MPSPEPHRMRTHPHATLLPVLLSFLAILVGCGTDPKTMIDSLRTGNVPYKQKVGYFQTLSKHVDQEDVLRFFLEIARDPYVCFSKDYRDRIGQVTSSSDLREVTRFRVLAIQALPDKPERRILQVLVENLSVTDSGQWSESWFGLVDGVAGTSPVREYARQKLQAITGEDFGYDAEKWKAFVREKYGLEL